MKQSIKESSTLRNQEEPADASIKENSKSRAIIAKNRAARKLFRNRALMRER